MLRYRPKHAKRAAEWQCTTATGDDPRNPLGAQQEDVDLIFWKVPGRRIIIMIAGQPGSAQERIVDCYRMLMGPSRFAPPQQPSRILVSSPAIAERLRVGLSGIVQVVCAPTPELEARVGRKNEEYEVYIPRWAEFDREQAQLN